MSSNNQPNDFDIEEGLSTSPSPPTLNHEDEVSLRHTTTSARGSGAGVEGIPPHDHGVLVLAASNSDNAGLEEENFSGSSPAPTQNNVMAGVSSPSTLQADLSPPSRTNHAAAGTHHEIARSNESASLPTGGRMGMTHSEKQAWENYLETRNTDSWEKLVDALRTKPNNAPASPADTTLPFTEDDLTSASREIINEGDVASASSQVPLFAAAAAADNHAAMPNPPPMASDSAAVYDLEIIDSDSVGPIPIGMTGVFADSLEGKTERNLRGIEQIEDYAGPNQEDAVFEENQKPAASRIVIDSLDVDSSPVPFDSAAFEEHGDEKKKALFDNNSIIAPPNEEMRGAMVSDVNQDAAGRRGWDNDAGTSNFPVSGDALHHGSVNDEEKEEEEDIINTNSSNASVRPSSSQELPQITEAYLVDNGSEEVIIATPLEPPTVWWKQWRAKLFLGTFFIIFAVLIIALSVSLSSNGGDVPMTNQTAIMLLTSVVPSLSLSTVPTSSPSFSLKPSPILSTAPSTSSSPTDVLYCIEIAIFYDQFPSETTWMIHRVFGDGVDKELVKSHQSAEDDTSHEESVCLLEGKYEFTISDSSDDGICCEYGEGTYTVTSNGSVIGEGGKFEDKDTTSFSIPFFPYPSISPSLSMAPSMSFSPSTYFSSLIWNEQGQPLLGDTRNDWSGICVALSANGNTLAVGSPGDYNISDRPGYVKVYHREDAESSWEPVHTIVGSVDGDSFGWRLAFSEDGKTLAVGAPGNSCEADRPGYVRVYYTEDDDSRSGWQQLGEDIIGEALGDEFGHSVSLSGDGKMLATGAVTNDNVIGKDSGHVKVFGLYGEGISPSWKQLGQDIYGEAAGDWSGVYVSLSADGKTVAIGAQSNDGNGYRAGHVRVYHMEEDGTGPIWQQLGQDMDGEAAGDKFGKFVSLSADGKTLAICASYNDGNGEDSGHARVYHMEGDGSSSVWQQLGQDIDGEAAGDQSGYSVSLSADGRIIAIGAHENDNKNGLDSGHVRVYYFDDVDTAPFWKQLGHDIDGVAASDESGYSVSLAADGKTVAIGSPFSTDNGYASGHARVFNIDY